MVIARPDMDNWVRDRALKFVSRATFKIWIAGIASLMWIGVNRSPSLPGFKAISVTMGYRSGLLSSGPSRRLRVCLEQRCPCVVVLIGGCFSALFQAQLIFHWVVHILGGSLEPGLPRTVGFMAGLTATLWAARRELCLFDERTGLCHCGEVRRRLFLSVQGVLVTFFSTSSDSLLRPWVWRAVHVWLPWRGCAEWLRRGTFSQILLLVKNFRQPNESARPCVEERWWRIILDPHPRGWPCRVAKMFFLAFDSRRGRPSKKDNFFSMQQRKAHLQCKCSWHTHTGTLTTHPAPSRSQTNRGTSPEAGTTTKKLLLRVHASLSFSFFF